MELILLRHGKAEDFNSGGGGARELVEKGRLQARSAAISLKRGEFLPDIVLTSPLVRARQTAEIFCEAAGLPGPVLQGWLSCGMAPEAALKELAGFGEFNRVMIVGHEPDFSSFIQWLLGSPGGSIRMKKGGIAGLKISPPSRNATLSYLIPPKLTAGE